MVLDKGVTAPLTLAQAREKASQLATQISDMTFDRCGGWEYDHSKVADLIEAALLAVPQPDPPQEICVRCGEKKSNHGVDGIWHKFVPQEPQGREQQVRETTNVIERAYDVPTVLREPAPAPRSAEVLLTLAKRLDAYNDERPGGRIPFLTEVEYTLRALSTAPAPAQGWQPIAAELEMALRKAKPVLEWSACGEIISSTESQLAGALVGIYNTAVRLLNTLPAPPEAE